MPVMNGCELHARLPKTFAAFVVMRRWNSESPGARPRINGTPTESRRALFSAGTYPKARALSPANWRRVRSNSVSSLRLRLRRRDTAKQLRTACSLFPTIIRLPTMVATIWRAPSGAVHSINSTPSRFVRLKVGFPYVISASVLSATSSGGRMRRSAVCVSIKTAPSGLTLTVSPSSVVPRSVTTTATWALARITDWIGPTPVQATRLCNQRFGLARLSVPMAFSTTFQASVVTMVSTTANGRFDSRYRRELDGA